MKQSLDNDEIYYQMNLAIQALRQQKMVIIFDAEDRESEGDLAFVGAHSNPEKINFCLEHGRGLLCLSMTPAWASKIGITRLPSNNKERFGTPFGMPINVNDGSSGISAISRSNTIRAASSQTARSDQFSYPGHVHTLIAHPDGLTGRGGHTESILELMNLAGLDGPGVLCEVLNSKGCTASYDELYELGSAYNIPLIKRNWIMKYSEAAYV